MRDKSSAASLVGILWKNIEDGMVNTQLLPLPGNTRHPALEIFISFSASSYSVYYSYKYRVSQKKQLRK